MTDIATGQKRMDEGPTFLGHPTGLYVLFLTEMWERFSYYGMRALLVLYLTKHFLFERDAAFGLYGAYTTLVYITPVIGGMLADRYLGQRKAVLFGAILLVMGHLGMAVEGEPVIAGGSPDPSVLNIFYLSLALIITGVGFLKANISTIVGELYPKTDGRRDAAFTIFYMGINMGAFLGALIAGYLGETYGWAYGFGAAGIGMLFGLVVFILGKPTLRGAGEPTNPGELKQAVFGVLNRERIIYLGGFAAVLVIWKMVQHQDLVGTLLMIAGALTLAVIMWRSFATLTAEERHRVFVMLFLIFVSILFWALFEQAGSSLNLYTDEAVDRTIFGFEVPASVFQSINAFYIVTLGPVFAALWAWLAKRGMEPSTPVKFGLGVLQVGLGFLVLVAGAKASGDALTPVMFIFLIYLLHTMGELCLSPVGLSAMTRLSVPSMVGLMMGTWFLASGTGNFAAALIAQATAGGEVEDAGRVIEVYSNVGWLAVGVAVVIFLISPLVKRGMHLDTIRDVDHALAGEQEIGEPAAAGVSTQKEQI